MSKALDYILQGSAAAKAEAQRHELERQDRIAAMRRVITGPGQGVGCSPKQRGVLDDYDLGTKYISVRCPRRSGKSFIMALLATYVGETRPGSRILIISLTLKSTRENYWSGSPSGIHKMNALFNLGLTFNETTSVWWHTNGSRGRLAGAETRADIEYLRGAAAEADIVILDECKSFSPGLLNELIYDVLEPGLMTRDGVLVMGGTPGISPVGAFYDATCETARVDVDVVDEDGRVVKQSFPTCVPYGSGKDTTYTFINEAGEEELAREAWSLHTWTIQDNVAVPKQWARALRIKRARKWADDHPAWRREYLGEWAHSDDGLVYYSYVHNRDSGTVTWIPEKSKDNVTGLPPEEGPWHLVFGLDLGFVDDTALVVMAYSEKVKEFRQVWDYKAQHLLPEDVVTLIQNAIMKFGHPVAVVGDAGNLGKMLVEAFSQRYGIPMVKAEKTEKFDHIELVNNDFHTGRIKIIKGSELDTELCQLMWDLDKGTKQELTREGKLKEDKSLPNHLCDALLYSFRFAYHYFAHAPEDGPERGTPAWFDLKERQAEERASRRKERVLLGDGLDTGQRPITREDVIWHTAIGSRPWN